MYRARIRVIVVAAFFILVQTSVARAVSIGFVPSSSTFEVGDIFDMDVVVSDIPSGQVVSAYDLEIAFDDSLVALSSLSFGSELGPPLLTSWMLLPTGGLHVAQTSLLSDAALLALQGSSLTLFTLELEALAPGTSLLSFSRGADDIKGVESNDPYNPSILTVDASGGQIEIVESTPEPATSGLLAVTLLAVGGWRGNRFRRRRQQRS